MNSTVPGEREKSDSMQKFQHKQMPGSLTVPGPVGVWGHGGE